jgi:sterol desaturase/sphingolipid hydroxylase (fatty acid hydroxylase superfamily)
VTDVLFYFGQHVAFTGVALYLITLTADVIDSWAFLDVFRVSFHETPLALQVVLVLILGDFVAYWGHRLQHRFDLLWRFHAVHHTSTSVDWLAAHREHPVDGVYTQTLINLPAIVLGFDIAAVLGVVAFRSVWAIFIHSNVKVPLGPFRYLVGSPQLHRIHHAKDRHVGNFANLAPWIDLLFGTYREGEEPEEMGIDEAMPESYLGLLAAPFAPRRSVAASLASEDHRTDHAVPRRRSAPIETS